MRARSPLRRLATSESDRVKHRCDFERRVPTNCRACCARRHRWCWVPRSTCRRRRGTPTPPATKASDPRVRPKRCRTTWIVLSRGPRRCVRSRRPRQRQASTPARGSPDNEGEVAHLPDESETRARSALCLPRKVSNEEHLAPGLVRVERVVAHPTPTRVQLPQARSPVPLFHPTEHRLLAACRPRRSRRAIHDTRSRREEESAHSSRARGEALAPHPRRARSDNGSRRFARTWSNTTIPMQ